MFGKRGDEENEELDLLEDPRDTMAAVLRRLSLANYKLRHLLTDVLRMRPLPCEQPAEIPYGRRESNKDSNQSNNGFCAQSHGFC